MVVVFLFHRDLRLEDNLPLQEALNYANKNKLNVLPLFIFTPEQVGEKAPVRSLKSIACMIQSLSEIDELLNKKFDSELCVVYDDNIKALEHIDKKEKIDAIFETKDYTPYAKKREELIKKWCSSKKIEFNPIDYLYLTNPGEILNKSGTVYQKFTSFYNAALRFKINEPDGLVKGDFVSKKTSSNLSNITLKDMIKKLKLDTKEIEERMYKGGREEGLYLLKTLPKTYSKTRDIMVEETSGLSVHHHFGSISIRETYYESKSQLSGVNQEEFIRQLYWRDFYGQIICFFKDLYGKDALEYANNFNIPKNKEKEYEDWCNGTTGVELVDAAMNQLNKSGYMHNRSRLLVSSFLCKNLDIPYRFGERYFADKLLDYDFSQNFGNWSFQDGHLPFARAPFRTDSAENYQKRFDKDKKYINEWL
jgi:deoxyribodipyrimidine photo-lyase